MLYKEEMERVEVMCGSCLASGHIYIACGCEELARKVFNAGRHMNERVALGVLELVPRHMRRFSGDGRVDGCRSNVERRRAQRASSGRRSWPASRFNADSSGWPRPFWADMNVGSWFRMGKRTGAGEGFLATQVSQTRARQQLGRPQTSSS